MVRPASRFVHYGPKPDTMDGGDGFITAGPRSYQLMLMACEEAGLPLPGTSSLWGRLCFYLLPRRRRHVWLRRREPQILLYPRSYVERIQSLPSKKCHRFNFIGLLFPPDVFPYRKWILDFARRHFDRDSYFCITSLNGCDHYEPLGPYDRTLLNAESEEKRFVPKQTLLRDRTYFDPSYFGVIAQSQFTLCPRGDEPWSMRFFEAIMCRSIPIVEDPAHTGRNALERELG